MCSFLGVTQEHLNAALRIGGVEGSLKFESTRSLRFVLELGLIDANQELGVPVKHCGAGHSSANLVRHADLLANGVLFSDSLHLEGERTKDAYLEIQVLGSVHLIKHQIQNLVDVEVLGHFQFQVEHDGLFTAVVASEEGVSWCQYFGVLFVVWIHVHCYIVLRILFHFELAPFVCDKQLADHYPALYQVHVLSLVRLLALRLAELYAVLGVLFQRDSAVVLDHVVHRPVIEVTFPVHQQVGVPVNVHTRKPLHH